MQLLLEYDCPMKDYSELAADKIRCSYIMNTYNLSILAYDWYHTQTGMLWKTTRSDNKLKFNVHMSP